eukprot:m51a1_g3580 hypothetical protein (372) ;mRNA; r:1119896-1121641
MEQQWRKLDPAQREVLTRIERPAFVKRLRDAWPFRIDDARHVHAYCCLLGERAHPRPLEAPEPASPAKPNDNEAVPAQPVPAESAAGEEGEGDADCGTDWIFCESLVIEDDVIRIRSQDLTDDWWGHCTAKKDQIKENRNTICRVCFCRKTFEEQLYLLFESRLRDLCGAFAQAEPLLSTLQTTTEDETGEWGVVLKGGKKQNPKPKEAVAEVQSTVVMCTSGTEALAAAKLEIKDPVCIFHGPCEAKHQHHDHYHVVSLSSIAKAESECCHLPPPKPETSGKLHKATKAIESIKRAIQDPSVDQDSLVAMRDAMAAVMKDLDEAIARDHNHTSLFAHDPATCVLSLLKMPDVFDKWRPYLQHEKCCCQSH